MTSILRKKIFETVINSLYEKVFLSEPLKILINIDNIGFGCNQEKIINLTKKYFDNVVYNTPKSPSFEAACIWLWENVDEEYFLHWEDDCELLLPLNICVCKKIMNKYPDLASIRFDDHAFPIKKNNINGHTCVYNPDGFHLSESSLKMFGTGPSFIRTEFIKAALPLLTLDRCMEKQFRGGIKDKPMKLLLDKWKIGWCYSNTPVWKELGVLWRKQNNIEKIKDGLPLRYEKK
jgi:hypothetical protein